MCLFIQHVLEVKHLTQLPKYVNAHQLLLYGLVQTAHLVQQEHIGSNLKDNALHAQQDTHTIHQLNNAQAQSLLM